MVKIIMRKQLVYLGILLSVLLLCSGCNKAKEGKTQVRVAYFPNITHSQALIMKEQGSLEKKLGADCEVSWLAFNAGPAEIEAMFAGEVDLGYIGPVPAMNAYVKSKGDIRIIANACDAGAVLLKSKDSEISSVADLSGKKVAIPQLGNTQHLCLLQLLKDHGLSAKSEGGTVEVVAVANADLQGLLEQGQIDAALPPEPWGSILEKQCDAKIVLDQEEVFMKGQYPTAVVIANYDFYKEHPDIVEAFLMLHKEATLYVNQETDQAIEIINRQIEAVTGKSIAPDIMKSAFQRLAVTVDISPDAIRAFGEIGIDQGFISKLPEDELFEAALSGNRKE